MQKKTILIVDDEPKTREGLKKTLEGWASVNYEVISAEGANEAISILKEREIHILLTDISMPEINGLEMLKLLKDHQQNPVVIIISAYSEFEYAQEAIRLGVLNYLLKPLNKRKLIEAVEQAVEVKEQREREGRIYKFVDEKLVDVVKQGDRKEDTPIQIALVYIDKHIDQQLTMKDVANYVHLNSSYFSVLFKEQVNMTFSEYLTRSRLQKAKNLLLESNLSVTEIAEKVGYNTSKYFIKLFKEYEGQTPSRFRKTSTISEREN
ncbi:chemotaxis protein CheY [Bacillus sp. SA1-12]|uniref:response regulator transcription factor n=1 Tax=Bacillus sp. SA1-12 TaxID=1455638 RepID=UPI000626A13C|nr:response regulator [Bacillus sp. SA1-12]KKI94054.1 chemotaxis protein CheY [Bacillus sp. SA1-12]